MTTKELLIYSMIHAMADVGPRPVVRLPINGKRNARICPLPGCLNIVTHNGGYCCAAHCREHQRQKRALARTQGHGSR